MQKDIQFPCPASQTPIREAVIIYHPNILPLIYDKASVIKSIDGGELRQFGITRENIKECTFADHFTQAVLDRINKQKLTLSPHVFDEGIVAVNANGEEDDLTDLNCAIIHDFVTGVGALCTRDGRLYDFAFLKLYLQNSAVSPMNSLPLNSATDIIVHPVHQLLKAAHARNPKDLINLQNLLMNYEQGNPKYLNIYTPAQVGKLIIGMFMIDPFLDYARIALTWQTSAGNAAEFIPLSALVSLLATAMIDIRMQYSLARKTAETRTTFHGQGYHLDVQHPIPNIPPAIQIPSSFFYITHFFKAYLAVKGFHAILIPGYQQQAMEFGHTKVKIAAIRELLMLYRQYELLRAFSQISNQFITHTKQRLLPGANEVFSLRRLLKRLAEAGILLGMSGLFLYGVQRQTQDIAFYGALSFDQLTWLYKYKYELTLRESYPIITSLGNIILYPLSLSFSWPELCTLTISAYKINESFFGNQYMLPPLFSLNTALLLFVAITLIPFMPDYGVSSIIDYIVSLVILTSKINVTDHIEHQLPKAQVGDRYRLLPQPNQIEVEDAELAIDPLVKKLN